MSDVLPGEENLPEPVKRQLDEQAPLPPQEGERPEYKVDPQSKIPVSKHHGKLFKSRLDAAMSARKGHLDAWDEAIRYYNNDQLQHRVGEEGASGNRYFSQRRNKQWSETENIVYANTRAIMPALYAKNPQVEFTSPTETDEDLIEKEGADAQDSNTRIEIGDCIEKLEAVVNRLATMRDPPGLNLKVHAKQGVLAAELCNLGWIEYGWTERDQSIDVARSTIEQLSKELAEAKDQKAIREIEGKLWALEEEVPALNPPGPWVRYRSPHDVVPDADCSNPDFSDARYIYIRDWYPTDYLNARYGEKQSDGSYKSIYEPTHVLTSNDKADDDIKNFKLLTENAEASFYGYKSKEQLEKAYRTECWRVWDRTTRRVYLYASNRWTYPIWVENDPYGLPGFYPLEPIYFNTSPLGPYARSNVTYYLDQQDAVNEIHDEWRRARQDTKDNVLFDNKMERKSVEEWLTGGRGTARGVEVPEGKSLKDMILDKPNNVLKAQPLFDVQRPLQSVDRVSGITDVMRGVQFKTNTTNKAIENYNSSTAMRLDEKIDAVEDWLGRVMYGVAFLCGQFMDEQMVINIIGSKRAEGWRTYTAPELRNMFQCQAVGGSTQKPTTAAKKQQALELAGILQKMAQFAPSVVLETTMRLFDDAFDEFTMPDDAFERIKDEAMQSMQRGNSTQGAGGGPAMPPGGPPQPGGEGGGPQNELMQVAMVIDKLPPQAKQALGMAIAKGVPIAEALPEVIRMVQQVSGGGQPQPNAAMH